MTTAIDGCPICLYPLETKTCAPCTNSDKHIFHIDCIREWAFEKNTCPTCRKAFNLRITDWKPLDDKLLWTTIILVNYLFMAVFMLPVTGFSIIKAEKIARNTIAADIIHFLAMFAIIKVSGQVPNFLIRFFVGFCSRELIEQIIPSYKTISSTPYPILCILCTWIAGWIMIEQSYFRFFTEKTLKSLAERATRLQCQLQN